MYYEQPKTATVAQHKALFKELIQEIAELEPDEIIINADVLGAMAWAMHQLDDYAEGQLLEIEFLDQLNTFRIAEI